jgi:processive 1,2-diacylglycerol beta-glucosyltransferase
MLPHRAEQAAARSWPDGQRRILVLSVSAGAGHGRAAEALRAHGSDFDASVLHLDVMDFVPAFFRLVYTKFYIYLVRHYPFAWAWIYQRSHDASPVSRLEVARSWLERICARALLREIARLAPDAIICTHFLPAEVLSRAVSLGRHHGPVWVQVTDFDLHRMWVQPGMAGYFVPNDELAFRLRARGVAAECIHVTGIPVMPAFGQLPDRERCAVKLGLDPHRATLVLMGGGAGIGSLEMLAARVLGMPQNFQLIVMAGRNLAALRALEQLSLRFPGRLVPCAYTKEVEQLMACADVAITKPGGLSTSECLAMGLPMILNDAIPGQEERNADFLLEQGAAVKACDGVMLEYRLTELFSHPRKLAVMRERGTAIGRPGAAVHALDIVLTFL